MDTALDMLKWVVEAYHPQWCASDKCYRCSFCRCEFVTSAFFHDTSLHKLGCQWAQAKVWLEDAQPATAQESSDLLDAYIGTGSTADVLREARE